MGLGEAKLTQVQAVVCLDAGDGDLGANVSIALCVVVVFQVDVQSLGAGGQIFSAGHQISRHGDAVDVFEVCILADVGIAIGSQRGFDDGHIEAGVVGNESFSCQHGVQLLPDGEEVWGVFCVLWVDAVDVDVALVIPIPGGLDEVVGRGHDFQSHHESQSHGTSAIGISCGGLKVDGDEVHMLVGEKRLIVGKRHEKNHSVL